MVISQTTSKDSFRNLQDAEYAERAFEQATREWNKFHIGVSFNKVNSGAVFTLVYGGKSLNCYARAFLPNQEECNVYVYKKAFNSRYKGFMSNFFRHEVGHIIGMRHEFAPYEGHGGVQLWYRNRYSCIGYTCFPLFPIQDSNVVGARALYSLRGIFRGCQIVNYSAQRGDASLEEMGGMGWIIQSLWAAGGMVDRSLQEQSEGQKKMNKVLKILLIELTYIAFPMRFLRTKKECLSIPQISSH